MQYNKEIHKWIRKQESRSKILSALKMPLTAGHIAKRTGIPVNTCSYTLAKFATCGLVICLNPNAKNSRLYWLTETGKSCRKHLCQELNIPHAEYNLADIDWSLFGWLCFSHRSVVIKTLDKPMQPAQIKRVLRLHKPNTKISANNIRDVIRLFLAKGIVRPVKLRKKAHPAYELTKLGNKLKQLLIQAESIC